MNYTVKILSIKNVTHDVNSHKVERPRDYQFKPGQAMDFSKANQFFKKLNKRKK